MISSVRRLVPAVLLVLVGLAGCTSSSPPEPAATTAAADPSETSSVSPSASTSGSTSGSSAPGTTTSGGATQLTIVVGDGTGSSTTSTLTCDPAGGTHPEPMTACRILEANVAALQPVAKNVACTQLYGGPETATITGTYAGQPVDSTLSRTNGCEIGRWDALTGLLPVGGTR